MTRTYRFKRRSLATGVFYYVMYNNDGRWLATGTTDPIEAEVWARTHGPERSAQTVTFREYAAHILDDDSPALLIAQQKGRLTSFGNLDRARRNLKLYLLPWFGNMALAAITPRMFDLKLTKLERAVDTKRKIVVAARWIFQQAIADGLLTTNPAKEIEPFVGKGKRRPAFTAEELRRMFPEGFDDLRLRWGSLEWALFFYLQASCGLRPGEVVPLQWEQWDKEAGVLNITHSLETKTRRRKEGTKTGGVRIALLTDLAGSLLAAIQAAAPPSEHRIFRLGKGEYVTHEGANKRLHETLRRLEIPIGGRSQYSLRHAFNTLALRRIKLDDVQTLMGHSTLAMSQWYDHADQRDIADRARALRPILSQLWTDHEPQPE